ncbi:hypothetical protein SLA2020_262150 [Shorea laevis]
MAKIEDIMDCGDRRGGTVFTEENGGFCEVDLLARPPRISVETIEDRRSFGRFCPSKNHEIISKEEVGNRGALARYFNPVERSKSFLFAD